MDGETECPNQRPAPIVLDGRRRVALGLSGFFCGVVAAWFFWNAQNQIFIVGVIFGEVGFLIGSVAVLLLTGAALAPTWFPRALTSIDKSLALAQWVLFLLPAGFILYVVVVCPILILLKWLGVW